ncbi:MAG: hypothetical protein EPN93_07295 [Spirochaetes bacterium]|nr:MAG: hypothetical protein EPN93_07295 [Spirochaetota bacterium]
MNPRTLILGALLLLQCAPLVLPERDTGSGAVGGIKVTLRSELGVFPFGPDIVYFARVDDGDPASPYERIVPTRALTGCGLVMFNPPPGVYVAVGAWYRVDAPMFLGNDFEEQMYRTYTVTVIFPEEVIRNSRIEIKPGGVAFCGSYSLRMKWSWYDIEAHLDATEQKAYASIGHFDDDFLDGGKSDAYSTARLLKSARGAETEDAFFRCMGDSLPAGYWRSLILERNRH